MTHYKLLYFNEQGRAEVARYIFAIAGVAYVDHRFEREEWPAIKEKTQFGVCPYLEVDGKVICQSRTIERYLGRKFGLCGSSDWDQARVDMVLECVEDFVRALIPIKREQNEDRKKEWAQIFIADQGLTLLNLFENLLKENEEGNSKYFVGNKITVADVAVYHFTNYATLMLGGQQFPESWSQWPGLCAVRQNVHSHPRIQEWIAKRPDTSM